MITLTNTTGDVTKFNLKSFEREQSLRDAWYSMQGDSKYDGKSINLMTTEGQRLIFHINHIKSCVFDECLYIKSELADHKITERKKQVYQTNKSQRKPSPAEMFRKAQDYRKQQSINKFVSMLQARGVSPNYTDPTFLKVCESVAESEDWKLPMFVNIYCKGRGK